MPTTPDVIKQFRLEGGDHETLPNDIPAGRLATALLKPRPLLYTIWYPDDVRRIANELLSEEMVAELDDAFCLDLLACASYDDALTEKDIASFIAEFIDDSDSIAWVRETVFRK